MFAVDGYRWSQAALGLRITGLTLSEMTSSAPIAGAIKVKLGWLLTR
jgi:hypothetical protein